MVSVDPLYPQRFTLLAAAEFTWNLYKKHVACKDGNLAISPFLVEHSLILLLSGSCGDTAAEIIRAIDLEGFPVDRVFRWSDWVGEECYKDGYSDVKIFSGAAFKRDEKAPIKKQFREYAEPYRRKQGFIRRSTLVGAEKLANSVISRVTCGQIETQFLMGDFTEATSVVVSSGIYLRAIWAPKNYFAKRLNAPYPFWKGDGGQLLTVPTFTCWAQPEHMTDEDCKVVGLELDATNYTIYFVLPNYDDVFGTAALTRLEERFGGQRLLRIVESLAGQRNQNHCWKMMVELPNFVVKDTICLEPYLRSMGIETAFDPNRCDLTNIADDARGMHLSMVRQSIKLKVTSAAAVYSDFEKPVDDGVRVFPKAWDGPEIHLNQPFLYFVFDFSTRAILLIGRCCMPMPKSV